MRDTWLSKTIRQLAYATSAIPKIVAQKDASPPIPTSLNQNSLDHFGNNSVSENIDRLPNNSIGQQGSRMVRASRTTGVSHVATVLSMLEERETARREELEEFSRHAMDDDEQQSSSCPIFDGFYAEGGVDAIVRLTNFAPREFNVLWFSLKDHARRYWNVGRGRHSQFKEKDVFFMLLVVLKNGGTWEMLSHIFHIKTPTFIKTVTGFLRAVAPKIFDDWVSEKADEEKMRMLATSGRTFVHFPCALYATDVTFQQANRPAGNMAEVLPFYSAQHKLYGYKVELSVSPRGFAINCTNHARGNTSDITMFRQSEAFHHAMRVKGEADRSLQDGGPMASRHPDEWAVLADKGYQGLAEHIRCIHPKKSNNLPESDKQNNRNISSDRIIVENWFGRLCGLWRICADKYRWNEDLYDDIFQVCAGLTNYHVGINPLRDASGEEHRMRQNRLVSIGASIKKNRRRSQDKYRKRKRLRAQTALNDMGDDEDDSYGRSDFEDEFEETQL